MQLVGISLRDTMPAALRLHLQQIPLRVRNRKHFIAPQDAQVRPHLELPLPQLVSRQVAPRAFLAEVQSGRQHAPDGHPLQLLRTKLDERRFATAEELMNMDDGKAVEYCGIVTLRQQPETAKGVVFVSLEDETGNVQVIVWPSVREAQPQELLQSRLLGVKGRWQRQGDARSLIARHLEDLTSLLGELETSSRDFR